jgi:RNA polymerase sigma-70 factor (ECF subfamily)
MAAVTDTVADIDAGFASQAPSVERNVISELDFEAFCVAVGSLPEKCRKAFVLRKVYQYSYREIAEYCGISVNTVKTYIKRGFKLVEGNYQDRQGR